MKIKMTALLALATSINAMAATSTLTGTGIDGKPCSVTIEREGDLIKKVELKGSAEVFEILAETDKGYMPHTSIRSYGGQDMIETVEDVVEYFKKSAISIGAAETFVLDTNKIPKTNPEEGIPGVKMVFSMGLNYQNSELSSVSATSRVKALFGIATLASSKFTCKK